MERRWTDQNLVWHPTRKRQKSWRSTLKQANQSSYMTRLVFTYLAHHQWDRGQNRINKASAMFNTLRKIWSLKYIPVNTKICIFNSGMENNKTPKKQGANVHKHLPQENTEHLLVRRRKQCRRVEKNKPGSHWVVNLTVALDRPHSQKTWHGHNATNPEMEPTKNEEKRSIQEQLEKR